MTPTNRAFTAFFGLLLILSAFLHLADRWIDLLFYGTVYAILCYLCNKYPQRTETVLLLILVPLPHFLGILGMYNWNLGNLSWDVVVHITSTFLGILFLDSFLNGNTRTRKWRTPSRVAIAVTIVILVSLSVEVIEWGGAAVGEMYGVTEGEGLLLRGPGDYCTPQAPCSTWTDTVKDCIDDLIGILLGIIAIGYKHAFKERAQPADAPQAGRSRRRLPRRR